MKRSEIEQLLPVVFQRTLRPGNALTAILDVMEAQHAPSEEILQSLDTFFHPHRTPDHFVPYLASWVDLERMFSDSPRETDAAVPPFSAGIGRLRELVAAAAFLSKWRGTARGLQCFLETATGMTGFEIEEHVPGPDGRSKPFHIAVRAPAEARAFRDLIERIISMEKPACVTHELHLKHSASPDEP